MDDFKQHAILVLWAMLITMAACCITGFAVYRMEESKISGVMAAMKANPPTIVQGDQTINNGQDESLKKFSIGVWPLHAGWCK